MIAPRTQLAVLAVLVAALMVAAGFVLSKEAPDGPASVVELPLTPTVSPLPPLELEHVPVRWAPVPDIFDFDAATEVENPFAGTFGGEESPVWRVYIAEAGEPEHELLATRRWVRGFSWDEDGLKLQAQTQRRLPSTLGTVTALWEVTSTVDTRTGLLQDTFDPLPHSGCTNCERGPLGGAAPGVAMGQNPGGDKLLVHVFYNQGIADPSRPPFLLREAYVVDVDGRSRRLEGLRAIGEAEGLPDLGGFEWLPGGDMLLGSSGYERGVHEDRYFIPLESGAAVFLRESLGMTWRAEGRDRVEPRDPRVVFAYYDAAGPQGPGNYLGLYNTQTGEAWQLGTAPPASRLNSSLPPSIAFLWPPESERFMAGMEPSSILIDPGNGARELGTISGLVPPYAPPEVSSPSGRYTAYFETREPGTPRDPSCAGLPYRLNLRDERNSETRVLLQCDTDVAGTLTWLSDKHLIAGIYNCSQCGPTESRVLLIDIDSGRWSSLTEGLEPRASAEPAPDGLKVAVLGDTLRVYDNLGRLIRDYGPAPAGMAYGGAIWSPDSETIVYYVAAESFLGGT